MCLESYTQAENLHLPCTYGYVLISSEGRIIKERTETVRGADAAVVFLKKLLEKQQEILDHISINKKMIELTKEQKIQAENATLCNHCHDPLLGSMKVTGFEGDYNVQDHGMYNH